MHQVYIYTQSTHSLHILSQLCNMLLCVLYTFVWISCVQVCVFTGMVIYVAYVHKMYARTSKTHVYTVHHVYAVKTSRD